MKNLQTLSIGVFLLLFGCQKHNYVKQIPAPTFHYVNAKASLPEKQVTYAKNDQKNAEYDTPVLIASSTENVPVAFTSANQPAYYPEAIKTEPKINKKPSFKEKTAKKIIARKIQKATTGKRLQSDSVNTMALLAGIFGILSVVLFFLTIVLGILFAAASIILGFIGKKQVSEGNGTGRGWAITGIALGFVTLLITAIFTIIIIALL